MFLGRSERGRRRDWSEEKRERWQGEGLLVAGEMGVGFAFVVWEGTGVLADTNRERSAAAKGARCWHVKQVGRFPYASREQSSR